MATHSDRAASERSSADETDASSTATVSTVESHARPAVVGSRRLRDRIEVATLRAKVRHLERERDALRDEVETLEAERSTLADTAAAADRRRQRVIDNYEYVIDEKNRDYRALESERSAGTGGDASTDRSLLDDIVGWLRLTSGD